jgi:TctA family transporter
MDKLSEILTGIFSIASLSSLSILFVIWIYLIAVSFIIGITIFVFWIIALIDCIRRDEKDFPLGGKNAKLIWLLLLILIRGIVGVIYFILIMRKKTAVDVKKKK